MGLLACVSADVDGQGTPLDEGLVAVLPHTSVWTLVGVDAEVSLQVGLPVETLVAHLPGALEGAGGLLGLHNFEQIHWGSVIKWDEGKELYQSRTAEIRWSALDASL